MATKPVPKKAAPKKAAPKKAAPKKAAPKKAAPKKAAPKKAAPKKAAPKKAVSSSSEVKLTLVAKTAYPSKRERRESTLLVLDMAVESILVAVKEAGKPIALSDLNLTNKMARVSAKHGFRLGKLRLYKGDDKRLYAGVATGVAVKVVGPSSKPSTPSKATSKGGSTPARPRAGVDPVEDAAEDLI
jgi:hypothetical protein